MFEYWLIRRLLLSIETKKTNEQSIEKYDNSKL